MGDSKNGVKRILSSGRFWKRIDQEDKNMNGHIASNKDEGGEFLPQ
jgi:hypothetical protein